LIKLVFILGKIYVDATISQGVPMPKNPQKINDMNEYDYLQELAHEWLNYQYNNAL
jgi:hypothetical protein